MLKYTCISNTQHNVNAQHIVASSSVACFKRKLSNFDFNE